MSETAHRNVVESVEGLIGDTPLLRLDGVAENLLGKVEAANAYSVKDRIAREMIDEVRGVTADEAREAARRLGREAGLLVGVSSGAALAAATEYATEQPGETVVVVLPDTGERYLSTGLFDQP
jgi:cysteine synthase